MWPEFDRSLNCKKKKDDVFWLLGPRIVSGKHLPQESSLLLELNSHKFEDFIYQKEAIDQNWPRPTPCATKSSKHPSFVAGDLCCNLIFPTVPKLEQNRLWIPAKPILPTFPTGEGIPVDFPHGKLTLGPEVETFIKGESGGITSRTGQDLVSLNLGGRQITESFLPPLHSRLPSRAWRNICRLAWTVDLYGQLVGKYTSPMDAKTLTVSRRNKNPFLGWVATPPQNFNFPMDWAPCELDSVDWLLASLPLNTIFSGTLEDHNQPELRSSLPQHGNQELQWHQIAD